MSETVTVPKELFEELVGLAEHHEWKASLRKGKTSRNIQAHYTELVKQARVILPKEG